MHRHILIASAALALFAAAPAMAQEAPTPPPTEPAPTNPGQQPPGTAVQASTPEEFAAMAASSNMFEIESSRIALEKAQESAVRDFAQHMIDDHTQASEQMMTAAQADGVSDVPQTMDPRHEAMLSQLQNASDEEFDAQYLDMQLTAHEEAVALFSSYSQQEGALADFAESTLPTLEEHLASVQELAGQQ